MYSYAMLVGHALNFVLYYFILIASNSAYKYIDMRMQNKIDNASSDFCHLIKTDMRGLNSVVNGEVMTVFTRKHEQWNNRQYSKAKYKIGSRTDPSEMPAAIFKKKKMVLSNLAFSWL